MKSTRKPSRSKAKSSRTAKDLAPRSVSPAKAGGVRGGRAAGSHDLTFTHPIDKASPVLMK